jgi:prepilin-type N-terminal cleavage/methylation domain-containing protein/prepilin-type processing-associated H-X9-DG protein
MRCDARCGFTLVELMIVIAIVGILAALLMPAMSSVWEIADDYRCTTNLYFLSQAIAMRRADVGMGSRTELRPLRWPNLLLPYLEDKGETFMCPVPSVFEEPSAVSGDPGDSGTGGTGWDTDFDGASGVGSNSYKAYPPLTELAELKIGTHLLTLDAGPWTIKLSDEQFQAAFAQGWFGIDNNLNDPRGHDLGTYQPGANPNLYYLCTEDSLTTSGGNQDYNDPVIRVLDKQNGSYELSVTSATSGTHYLVSKPDGQTLLQISSGGYGGRPLQTQQISVGVAEEDSSSPSQAPGTSNNSVIVDPDTQSSAGSTILSSNYAMNADARYMTYRSGKLMLMDYYRYISHYSDNWSAPALDPNRDGIPNFARHRGRINVLLTDGSVQFMDPAELDPLSPKAYDQYWAP